MPLILVSNPVCGNKSGHAFVQQHVLPLLMSHGIVVDESIVTDAPGHAGRAVVEFVHKRLGQAHDRLSVILSSGDGTLHEIINALLSSTFNTTLDQIHRRVYIALVPSGTANALYSTLFPSFEENVSYKLQAVQAFITNRGKPKPLTITETTIDNPSLTAQTVYSTIVTSASLHASILHDSEVLREEVPDLERFKVAARNNITRWYKSDVILLPAEDGRICTYNPQRRVFEEVPRDLQTPEGSLLKGPFAYFTSTVNVDRLEPSFMISSLQSSLPTTIASMEIVALRPTRCPTVQGDKLEDREHFAKITSAVLSAAYKGTHADLTYDDGGKDGTSEKSGIAEYIRCGGWKWTPADDDDAAHLICADGSIFRIGKAGSAVCKLYRTTRGLKFYVYQ